MRVAFVSYEYPPDTALGGISTYVAQMARCLAGFGIDVEVFCGSLQHEDSFDDAGVRVHRVKSERMKFPEAIVPVFARRHRKKRFDVIEGPDYLAEGRAVARCAPEVPYVVKLHTPYHFVKRFNQMPLTRARIRETLRLLWYVAKTRDFRALVPGDREIVERERENLLLADEVVAPSHAIAEVVGREWHINPARMSLVPLVYEPAQEMLDIPIETDTHRVTFVGRLEWRKGVQDLARAMPAIMQRQKDALFRFVGAIGASSKPGVDMKTFILDQLPERFRSRVEFTGGVSPEAIPRYLADTDVCVFPSRWESFGFVVLEAMSAGRAVVCTGNGGMAELVDNGEYGLLVPPKAPRAIANRVIRLLANPNLRHRLGRKARTSGLNRYTTSSVAPLQLRSYEKAISSRRRQTLMDDRLTSGGGFEDSSVNYPTAQPA